MDVWIQYTILISVGFVVGFINTVAGGASLLSLPMFIFMGLPPAVANGTNRVAILAQTAVGAAGFKSKGVGNFPFNLYLGLSAMIGAVLGAQISVDIKGETFNKVLVVIMFVVIGLMVLKPKAKKEELLERLTGKYLWLSIVAFFFIGIYGGFINAGIGFVIMLFLNSVNRLSLVKTNATKVSVVFFYTIAALTVFVVNDKVNWTMGLVHAIGNASGAWVSSRYSVKKGDGYIRVFLIVMVIAMSIKLWFTTYE